MAHLVTNPYVEAIERAQSNLCNQEIRKVRPEHVACCSRRLNNDDAVAGIAQQFREVRALSAGYH